MQCLNIPSELLVARERGDPTTPNPSNDQIYELSLEVDFYEEGDFKSLNTPTWESGIKDNDALYGIDVDIKRDEVLSRGERIRLRTADRAGCLLVPERAVSRDRISASKETSARPSPTLHS